jgi:hypothetical protein
VRRAGQPSLLPLHTPAHPCNVRARSARATSTLAAPRPLPDTRPPNQTPGDRGRVQGGPALPHSGGSRHQRRQRAGDARAAAGEGRRTPPPPRRGTARLRAGGRSAGGAGMGRPRGVAGAQAAARCRGCRAAAIRLVSHAFQSRPAALAPKSTCLHTLLTRSHTPTHNHTTAQPHAHSHSARPQKEGLVVEDVVVLIDREQGGQAHLAANGLRLHAAFRLSAMLDVLQRHKLVSDDVAAAVRAFIAENQTKRPDAGAAAAAAAPAAAAAAAKPKRCARSGGPRACKVAPAGPRPPPPGPAPRRPTGRRPRPPVPGDSPSPRVPPNRRQAHVRGARGAGAEPDGARMPRGDGAQADQPVGRGGRRHGGGDAGHR